MIWKWGHIAHALWFPIRQYFIPLNIPMYISRRSSVTVFLPIFKHCCLYFLTSFKRCKSPFDVFDRIIIDHVLPVVRRVDNRLVPRFRVKVAMTLFFPFYYDLTSIRKERASRTATDMHSLTFWWSVQCVFQHYTLIDVCVTVHHWYNDVSNQQDATNFSFINLFKSVLHVPGDQFAHPQEHFLTIHSFWYNVPTLLPTGDVTPVGLSVGALYQKLYIQSKSAPEGVRISRPERVGLI